MAELNFPDLVQADRVHKSVYTDQQIFDKEMESIYEKVWVYCGHAWQIPNAGDYYAVKIGRQPMMMVRAGDGTVHVLHNRCPHRGVSSSATSRATPAAPSSARTTPGASTSTASCAPSRWRAATRARR